MIKMAKNQVCYEKTCWSTKNTVIEAAEKMEEEHFKEELDRRIEPHSHKKNSKDEDGKNKDIKNEVIYDLSKTYLKDAEFPSKKNPEYDLRVSYGSDIPDGEKAISLNEKNSKKVDGFVKLTLSKVLKVGEYIMALTTPQWNKVTGSPEDLDTYALTISQKDSINDENAKYEIGYNFLRYRN